MITKWDHGFWTFCTFMNLDQAEHDLKAGRLMDAMLRAGRADGYLVLMINSRESHWVSELAKKAKAECDDLISRIRAAAAC